MHRAGRRLAGVVTGAVDAHSEHAGRQALSRRRDTNHRVERTLQSRTASRGKHLDDNNDQARE